MNNEFYIVLILIIVGAAAYFLSKKKEDNTAPETIFHNEPATVDSLNNADTLIYNRFANEVAGIIKKFNCSIITPMVLAVIKKESSLLFQTKANKDITGDFGYSIGYMQVSRYALSDVNQKYNLNYSIADLSDEYKNLVTGILYLQLCYNSAQIQNSNNPTWLAFKKYNGGIDETDKSLNTAATKYADSTYNYFLTFTGV